MRSLGGLTPILAVVALLAGILAGMDALASRGKADLLIPSTEGAATQLVVALGAHRASGAHEQLAGSLKEQVRQEDLLALARAIEAGPLEGIEDAHEVGSQAQGDRAVAVVRVKFSSLTEQVLEFPLVRENGLWKVDSLAPLNALPKGNNQK